MKRSSALASRRLLLLALAAVYLLPSVLGILLQAAHSAEHAMSRQAPVAGAAPGVVVHSHDGSTHSHGGAVAILATAVADEQAPDEEEDPEAVPPLLLLAALPAGHAPLVTSPSAGDPAPEPFAVFPQRAHDPPLRPPRG